MPPAVQITDKRKRYDELIATVFGLKKPIVIDFGIFGAKGGGLRKGVLTVVEIAAVHEFGSASMGIPSRSFLRAFFDQYGEDLMQLMANLMESVVAGKRKKKDVLDLFAAVVVGKIKQRIANSIPPPLKAATIRRKNGKATPLINTGQMRGSITYRVRQGGEEVSFPEPADAETTPEQHRERATAARKKERAEANEKKKAVRSVVRDAAKKTKAAEKAKAGAKAKASKARAKARRAAVRGLVKAVKSKVRNVKKAAKSTVRGISKAAKKASSKTSTTKRGPRGPKKGG